LIVNADPIDVATETFFAEETESIAASFEAAEIKDCETAEVLPDEELQISTVEITDNETAEEEKLREFKARYQLSVRETEVLQQIMLNRSINEIADALFISPRTVKFHISSLLRKTGASSQRTLKRELTERN